MQKIGIFYGSDTGNSEMTAQQIQQEFGADIATIFDVVDAKASDLEEFSNIIFGASTMGIGDLQYDFEDFLPEIEAANLEGKVVAIFGMGDQYSYPDSFVDAIGDIYEVLEGKGCKIVGQVPTDGYDYDESRGEIDGEFAGLPLDEENQSDLSDERIKEWVEKLKKEFI
ncbi:MAG TPA: flavodoxin [Dysgonamonadaceae bacterium]|nr:flavodoxin [Dysgonamonadaceae bacterium]